MTGEQIEALLEQARTHRSAGDLGSSRTALTNAIRLADQLEDPAWSQITRWRSAKAAFDDRDPSAVLDLVEPLLALDEPFEHYPTGIDAIPRITRQAWDSLGYADGRIDALWSAWTRHHRRAGDPYLAAMGEVHTGWALACRGELPALSALLDRWSSATPRSFGRGPHRHADAPDTRSSVFWVQRDVARTVLRGATWAGVERLAWSALETLHDAVQDIGTAPADDYWFLEPVGRAQLRFGWSDPGGVQDAWPIAAAALTHPRSEFHRALTHAELARRDGRRDHARETFERASTHAEGAGPEWMADALIEACTCGAIRHDDVRRLIDAFGLTVFAGTATAGSPATSG